MTVYAAAGRRPGVAHIPYHLSDEIGRWLCGGGSANPTPLGDTPALPICRNCDGAALGPVVYRAYGDAGDLIYIGSTMNIVARLSLHSYTAAWWPAAEIRLESHPTEGAARLAEALAIRSEQPRVNRAGR